MHRALYFYLFISFLLYCNSNNCYAQVNLTDAKGSIRSVDTSKWSILSTNIYNKNAGNVGIGTNNPGNKLEIKQGTAGNSGLRFTNLTSSVIPAVSIGKVLSVNNNGDVVLLKDSCSTGIPISSLLNALNDDTLENSAYALTWMSTGLGTKTALRLLSNSNTSAEGIFNVTNTAASGTGMLARFRSNSAASSGMTIFTNGNVSIGTTTPAFTTPANTGTSIPTLGVDGTINATNYTGVVKAFGTVTTTAQTWDQSTGSSATITLGSNVSLTISNAKPGMYGVIVVRQDGVGSRTLTLVGAAGLHKVINGGGGTVTLSSAPNAADVLSYFYDGTNYWWTIGYNYN